MPATEAQEAPADRPQRSPNPRLATSMTRVALPGIASGGTARLLNLSTTGACVELGEVVEEGQSIELKLAHPRLKVVPTLNGEVMWSSGEGGTIRAGVQFHEPTQADSAVRPFLTAEAGSCLLQDGELVGFVVPHGKARTTWSLFEASGKRLAVAAKNPSGYEVRAKTQRAGSLPSFQAGSLWEAACKAIGVEDPLKLEPPVAGWREDAGQEASEAKPEEANAAEASAAEASAAEASAAEATSELAEGAPPVRELKGRAVVGPSGPLGSLCEAEVENAWVVVDTQGNQRAFLAKSGDGGTYQICSMADAIDDELEFRTFPDLDETVAAVFGLGAAETFRIGDRKRLGRVEPARFKDSDSSVELDAAALQTTLEGFPGPPSMGEPAPPPRPLPKKPRSTGSTRRLEKRDPKKIAVSVLVGAAVLAISGFLLQMLVELVAVYTS